MKTFTFKTNINCGGCVAAVTPFLNNESAISEWKVDTNDPEKILTVTAADTVTPGQVIEQVTRAGFKIEEITN
jgi:copper chaperone